MPRISNLWVCLVVPAILVSAASPAAAGDGSRTVYEVLQEYDFPVGLLPQGITSYELDESTGKFTVYLDDSCSFSVDDYKLKYKTKISGVISKDKIKDLSGIQVKVLFFWLNIVEVTRDGDELELSVGIASADFPVDNFYESPQCGCGFDCDNELKGVKSRNKSVSLKSLLSSS